MELQNIDVETRIWPNLQTVDGSTLQLAPQEIGDVAVSEAPNDPFLRPVRSRGQRPPRGTDGAKGEGDVASGGSSPADQTKKPAAGDASGKED